MYACMYALFVCLLRMYVFTYTYVCRRFFNTFEFHYIVMCLFLEYGGLDCHFCLKTPRRKII